MKTYVDIHIAYLATLSILVFVFLLFLQILTFVVLNPCGPVGVGVSGGVWGIGPLLRTKSLIQPFLESFSLVLFRGFPYGFVKRTSIVLFGGFPYGFVLRASQQFCLEGFLMVLFGELP